MNPFIQTTELELPKDRKERNRWYRYYFMTEPLIQSAIRLHTEFPLSTFDIVHEDPEIQEFFNEVAEDTNLFEFILDMGMEYWVTGECCKPGTKILLKGGLEKNIEDVQRGDLVLTHTGNYRSVTELMIREVNEDIYRIHVMGLYKPLEVTGNHPVFALGREGLACEIVQAEGLSCLPVVRCSNGYKYNCKKKVHNHQPKFIKAGDLKVRDYVVLPINKEYRREDKAFSKEWCRLFGYYLSEGCVDYSNAGEVRGFCIVNTDKNIIDEAVYLISKIVTEKAEISVMLNPGEKTCYSVDCDSRILAEDFLKHGGRYAKEKKISERVMRLSFCQQAQILSTYLNGDGSYDKSINAISLYTASEVLATQLYLMMLRCGFAPSIGKYITKHPSEEKPDWRGVLYEVCSRATDYSGEYILDSFKIPKLERKKPNHRRFIYNKLLYSPITKIEKVSYKGPVFNLEVEEDHSYIANKVAVHNCIPFGFLDDVNDPKVWTDFILLHPNFVEIESDPWVRGKRKSHMWLTPTDMLKKIVEGGTKDEKTGPLYEKLPSDIVDSVKAGKIELNELQVSHLKRTGNYFNTRGTSIIDCVLKLLIYKDKLRSAQYAIADRHITPFELYTIGEPGDPADEDELEKFQQALVASWTQPNKAIIWHHAVRMQWEGASGRVLPLQPEFDQIDNQIMAGLMLSKAFLYGEGPCYPIDTQVLTKTGWKYYDKVLDDDLLATMDPEAGTLYYAPFKERIVKDWDGEIINFKRAQLDVAVTPNHWMWINTESRGWHSREASQVPHNCNMRTTVDDFNGEIVEDIHIGEKIIPLDIFVEFLGYYLSEGNNQIIVAKSGARDSSVTIAQAATSKYFNKIKKCLDKMPYNVHHYKYSYTYGEHSSFCICNKALSQWIQDNVPGKSKEKFIPVIFKNLPKRYLQILLTALVDGDGSRVCWDRASGKYRNVRNGDKDENILYSYGSISKRLADDVQEIAFKCGYGASLLAEDILPSKNTLYGVSFSKSKIKCFPSLVNWDGDKSPDTIQKYHYKGKVWCFEIPPDHLMVVRRNGKITVCCNTYANASVALDVLIQRYLLFRMRIENWVERCVFGPLCKIHELYKPKESELTHKVRIEGRGKRLWLPEIKWTKEHLRDNVQKIQIMQTLAEKEIVPWKMVTPLLNIDWEVAKQGMVDQRKEAAKVSKELPSAVPPGPGLGPLPTPLPMAPGGGAPLPTAPEEGRAVPPESHEEMELPGSI